MTRLPPMLRFLADVDLDMGPFGVLGLTPESCDDGAIAAALARQLGRVARHPHGNSVEADEVRLALHVAAAQLRDPAVREELIEDLASVRMRKAQQPPRALAPSVPPASPSSPTLPAHRSPGSASAHSFEHTAMWVIAHSGGWNAESKRRLWALAHATSVSPTELPEVIARVARRASGVPFARPISGSAVEVRQRPAARRRELPRAVPLPVEQGPLRKWGPLALIGLLTLSSIVMVRIIAVIRSREIAARTIHIESIPGVAPAPLAPPVQGEDVEQAAPGGLADVGETPEPTRPAPTPDAPPALASGASDADQALPPSLPATMDGAAAPWLEAAGRVISSTSLRPSAEERLVKATRLALVNCAAELHAAGDEAGADEARRQAESLSPYSGRASIAASDLEAQLFRMTAPATSDDGRVALQFQLARRQPGSPTDALNRLRFRQTPLGPADCDVIAEVALYAPTLELRTLARRFVDDQSTNPFMVYGLLEAASRAPRTQSSNEIIERITLRSLPRPTDPDWPRAARAALVARLYEMLSPDRTGVVDDLAATLTQAYARSAGATQPAGASADEPAASTDEDFTMSPTVGAASGARAPDEPPDSEAASLLLEVWNRRAEPFRASGAGAVQLEEIARRRAARRALADGVIQRFAAEQAAIVETAAFVVAAERPTRAGEVQALLESLIQDRRAAQQVFEQIEANERALTRLWMIRFGAPPSVSGGTS